MTPALIEPAVGGRTLHDLRPGDHWCELYHHDQEHLALLQQFFADGFAQNHKVLYIAEDHVAAAQLAQLERAGLDIAARRRSGQLVVCSPREVYLVDGRFDRRRMLVQWERECQAALAAGYTALRAAGEPTWALENVPGTEDLAAYESDLNDFARAHPCIIFCQYDARRFPPRILLDVLSSHPVAVLDTAVVGNPYFVPPEDARSEQREAAKLTRWVAQLRAQGLEERRAQLRNGTAASPATVRALRILAAVAAWGAAAIALAVLAGYVLGLRVLTAFGTTLTNARPLAALAILFGAGALLLCLRPAAGRWARRWRAACTAALLLVGGAGLLEWMTGISLSTERLLFSRELQAWDGGVYAGRISLPTALAMLLLAAALLLLDWEPRRGVRPAQWLALAVATLSVVVLQGHTFGVAPLSNFGLPIAMSLPVGLSVALLALGTLFARPDAGAMRVVSSGHAGGAVLRWVLPVAVGGIWFLGWFSQWGLDRKLYPQGVDQLLFALPLMLLFAVALSTMARLLNRAGERQEEQHLQLERLNRELETRVEHRTARLLETTAALEAEVAQRRASEEELRRLNRALKALSRCSDAVTRAASEGTLLQEVCDLAVQVGGYRLVWVGYAQDDAEKSVLPMAFAGDGADYVANARITWADTERGQGPTGIALRTGEPHFVADISSEAAFTPWREAALRRGYHSVMTAPLKEGERAFGTLNFYAAEPDAFDAEERSLVVELAATLSYAVQALRARVERDRIAAEARALNETLEHRVEERTAALAAANQELEAFTYSVAHDLRTPLRHIHGFISLLAEDYAPKLDETAREYVDHVVRGSQQMGQLIDDLLNLSRVGRQPVQPQVVGLNRLVEDVRAELAPEAQGRRVTWIIGELPFLECDAALVRQVFHNLLANALKFTRPRADATIAIGRTERDGETVLFVRDNGVGFNMKYADKLFGVFQRLHRQEDFEGTGVGLVTVQRIIRKHGGRIWAEAELDRGATFYFTLGTPVESPAAEPVAALGEDSHAPASR